MGDIAEMMKEARPNAVKAGEEEVDQAQTGDQPVDTNDNTDTGSNNVSDKPVDDQEGNQDDNIREPVEPSDDNDDKSNDVFDINKVNEQLGKEFDSIDSLKQELDKSSNIESELQTYKDKLSQYEETIREIGDPSKRYANEYIGKLDSLIRKHPELDASVASTLLNTDVNEISNEKALVLDEIIKKPHKAGRMDSVSERIKDKYGLNADLDDMSEEDKRRYNLSKEDFEDDAYEARERIKQYLDFDVPEPKDPSDIVGEKAEQKQKKADELKSGWEPVINKNIEDISEITFDGVDFKYQVDEDTKKSVQDHYLKYLVDNGIDFDDPKVSGEIKDAMVRDIKAMNLDKILKSAIEDERTRMSDEEYRRLHNPSVPKGTQQTDTADSVEARRRKKEEKIQAYFNRTSEK